MGFISGSWENTKLICKNHGEDLPNEMKLEQVGKKLVYLCPCYYKENRKEGEKQCTNKLYLTDYEKMLEHVADEIIKGDQNGVLVNLKNHKWKNRKGARFHILKQTAEETLITMINPSEV